MNNRRPSQAMEYNNIPTNVTDFEFKLDIDIAELFHKDNMTAQLVLQELKLKASEIHIIIDCFV